MNTFTNINNYNFEPYLPVLVVVVPVILLFILYKIFSKIRVSGSIISPDGDMGDSVILEIKVPKSIDLDEGVDAGTAPIAAEQMFASLHGLLREDEELQEHFTFEIVSGSDGIRFFTVVPKHVAKFVESQIYAQYPTAHIVQVEDYTPSLNKDQPYEIGHLLLSKSQIFPIKTFRDFEVDPLSAITSTLSEVGPSESIWFQLMMRPIPDIWQDEGYQYIEEMTKGKVTKGTNPIIDLLTNIAWEFMNIIAQIVSFGFAESDINNPAPKFGSESTPTLTTSQELEIESIDKKLSKMGFEVVITFISSAPTQDRAKQRIRSAFASMRQFSTANLNSFISRIESSSEEALSNYIQRRFEGEDVYVLNTEEMASIFHLPTASVETPNINWIYSKKGEPPAGLPTSNCTYLGETTHRDKRVRFGISNEGEDRLRHMYLIGKSGTGKSTLFENMISQDIYNGFGVGVLDPHGELIESILEYIPDHRKDDVILVDPSDYERPVGINLLELSDPEQKNLMASALVSAVKVHFEYSWGPRLEYLLNYAILTLLEVEGTTMLGITRLLGDPNYQKYILHFVKDPVVLDFWEKEFKAMRGNQRLITEAMAPIQNKINRFLASTTIRNILGQRRSTIDIWDAMNSKKILLLNLSKGKIGEDNANLLGALLVSRIQFMALQRTKIPKDQRVPFYLYVDEFQNFTTGTFESILSESRKYKLGLYLTHQYTAQLPENLLQAVFGNVGTIATFALGAPDARELSSEFMPYFTAGDIISMERYHMYIKLMTNGMTSQPFSAISLPPIMPKVLRNKPEVVQMSRQKYGTEREKVEHRIRKWIDTPFDKGMAIAYEHKRNKESEEEL